MDKRLLVVAAILASGLLLSGCNPPPSVEEVRVFPQMICPCETVRAQGIYRNAARIQFRVVPGDRVVGAEATTVSGNPVAHVVTIEGICEPSSVVLEAWIDETFRASGSAVAQVVLGEELVQHEFPADCRDGVFAGFASMFPDHLGFSTSLVVHKIRNDSDRPVTLQRDGEPCGHALPGDDFPGCTGLPFAALWQPHANPRSTAREIESCVPSVGDVGPAAIRRVAIPPLTLTFTLTCPE